MFRKISGLLKNFFESLFGSRKSDTPSTAPADPLLEDGSDISKDTIVTTPVVVVSQEPFDDPAKDIAVDGPPPPGDDPASTSNPPSGTGGNEPVEPKPEPVPTPPTHKPRYLWCLDNGHGKLQAGKRSPKFTLDNEEVQFFEYLFNRDIVKRIIKALDEKGVQYFDVVPDVEEVGSFLKERVDRANNKKSDLPKLFVSVHSNAGPPNDAGWTSATIKGAETWHHHKSTKGKKMAEVFQQHIISKTSFQNRGLKSTKDRQLYVLVKTAMPAILTENGFFNNEEEVKALMSDSMRQKVADAHAEAILEIEKNGL